MATNHDGYFSRSLALLKKDRGWEKALLVLASAALVPVVGVLGVQGYALEWARLTAWGVDAAPKQKNVRIGECIKSGWRGFLGGAGYVVAAMLINGLLNALLGENSLTNVVGYVVSLVAGVLYVIGALRATIYQDFVAGYRLDRIWDMITRDFEGVTRITLLNLVIALVASAIVALLTMLILMPILVSWGLGIDQTTLDLLELEYLDGPTMRLLFFGFVDAVASAAPWLAIVFFVAVLCTTFQQLIVTTAVGLWMRNFNVPAWGASEDPLPAEGSYANAQYEPVQDYGNYGQDQSWTEADPYGQPADATYAQDVYAQPTNSGYVPPEYAQQYAQTAEPAVEPYTTPAEEPLVVQPIVVPVIDESAAPAAAESSSDVQQESAVEPFVMRDVWAEPAQEEAPVARKKGRDVIEVISLTDVVPEVAQEEAEPAEPSEAEEPVVVEEPVEIEETVVEEEPTEAEEPTIDEEPVEVDETTEVELFEIKEPDDIDDLDVVGKPVEVDDLIEVEDPYDDTETTADLSAVAEKLRDQLKEELSKDDAELAE